jgi:peptidoglycan/LPS O-acetylase OafA/YrhL
MQLEYRLFGIFRLVLAVFVAVQHMLHSILPAHFGDAIGSLEVGSVAVLMFFALSGFIVCEAAERNYTGRPSAFAANRLLRIVPTYILAVLATWAIARVAVAWGASDAAKLHILDTLETDGLLSFGANLLAVFPGGKSILDWAGTHQVLDISWALRVEMLFYFVLAAAIAASALFKANLAHVLFALAAGALALDLAGLGVMQTGLLQFMPYFVFGGALYYASAAATALGQLGAWSLTAAGFALSLKHIFVESSWPSLEGQTRDATAQLVLFLVLITIWLLLLRFGPLLVHRWAKLDETDRFWGDLTYPLYLLHTAVLVAAAIAIVAAIAVSWLATVYFEAWIARMRARVRGSTSKTSA